MGRKAAIVLVIWFVAVAGIVAAAYVPLSHWKSSIQRQLPRDVYLKNISGHWWRGNAQVEVHNLKGAVSVNWALGSLFEPFNWQVSHSKFRGFGQAQASLDTIKFWIEGFNLEADTFNGLMKRERIEVQGAPVMVERWYVEWSHAEQAFTQFRGMANWSDGEIQYPVGRTLRSARFSDWQLLGRLDSGAPDLQLRSEANTNLAGVKLLPSNELEVTVMPSMVEALGQRWNGSQDYPAFVMVQPIL